MQKLSDFKDLKDFRPNVAQRRPDSSKPSMPVTKVQNWQDSGKSKPKSRD